MKDIGVGRRMIERGEIFGYADDLVVVIKGESCGVVVELIRELGWYGLEVNVEKSSYFGGGGNSIDGFIKDEEG